MFHIDATERTQPYCDGMSRRNFVQLGIAGMASIGLPGLFRAARRRRRAACRRRTRRSS